MTDIPELQSLAQKLLTEELQTAEFIELLNDYSEAFEVWYPSIDPKNNAPDIRALLDLHSALVEKAQGVLKSAGAEIAKLNIKGKGIRAYTDILPKRISTTKVQKG